MSSPRRDDEMTVEEIVPCPKCLVYVRAQGPMLYGALASVGIEHGASSGEMLRRFAAAYHGSKHREPSMARP